MFKFIGHHWQRRRERFYSKNRWHLILDFSLGLIIVLLSAATIGLYYYHPVVDQSSPLNQDIRPEYDINNPPLNISLKIASSSIRLNEGVILKVGLKNSGKAEIKDIKIDLLTSNRYFAIGKMEERLENESARLSSVNNREILVSSLTGHDEINIEYDVNFIDKTKTERVIKWQAQIQYSIGNQIFKELVGLDDVNLAAELEAEAVVYYNSPQGDQLGSGPIPPVVGLPTNYWIFFEVKSAGDFSDLVFSGKLPKGLELTDRRSVLAGDLRYNSSTRQVIWTVPELVNQSDSYRAGFEVQLIPSEFQKGKVVNLMTGIKYYALDTLIKDENANILPDLDTNLIFDRINKGQGEVESLD